VARLYYFLKEGFSSPEWIAISKQRLRFLGYVTLKGLWPQSLRPVPFWKRFARAAAPLAKEWNPPSYLPLIESRGSETRAILERYALQAKKYYALMPASRWKSKEWSPQKYVELACTLHSLTQATLALMGRESDEACQWVKRELTARKIPLVTVLNENDFQVTALILQQAIAYVGGDTGLAHLAEAVGTPSVMLFGPTRPDLGFGPWSRQSVSVSANVWCSPCSKDGRICYRYTDRFACLKRIEVDRVRGAVPK
jgi:ADP-heptose:LPS heptosyltransferase